MEVQFLLLPGQLDMSDGAGCPLHIRLREPHWNLLQGHNGTTLKTEVAASTDFADFKTRIAAL